MSLIELLRTPQRSIASRLAGQDGSWILAFSGYFFLSLAEGQDRVATRFPGMGTASAVALSVVLAALLGTWIAAGSYGGALHVGARVLGGRPGVGESIQAVGLGLFWPGLFAACAAVVVTLTSATLPRIAMVAAFLNVAAGLWALYATIAAIRVRHAFSWWRAVLSWLLPILVFGGLVLILLVWLRQ